ncbi:MAG: UDP-galactopyranose mutase [Chlorobiaceae bacterium]
MRNLVVGCGFSGATIANKIATEWNENVLVIDKKLHVAGNCYDYWRDGINIHQYGPHIFHTDIKEVWDYISQFTKWFPYQHKVKALIDGMEVPIPFNLNSIHQVFPQSIANKLEQKLLDTFGFNVKVPILEFRKTGDKDLLFLADYVYDKIFLPYTLKQWGMTPEDLSPTVTGRVPIYISRDDRYFQNIYQGIPLNGYTPIIEKMLNHSNIEVRLNTNYNVVKNEDQYTRVFYTGSIDEFFCYEFGELPYRSLIFDLFAFDRKNFQSNALINYPSNYDFTRIVEYKYFLDTTSDKTFVSYEYPQVFMRNENDRYYPIIKDENQALFQCYLKKAQAQKNTYFLGRLGDYKYYDMDQAIERAFKCIFNMQRI